MLCFTTYTNVNKMRGYNYSYLVRFNKLIKLYLVKDFLK